MSKITLGEKKSPLECMFIDLSGIYDEDDESVKQELIEMGIDIKKAQNSFKDTLNKCKNKKVLIC